MMVMMQLAASNTRNTTICNCHGSITQCQFHHYFQHPKSFTNYTVFVPYLHHWFYLFQPHISYFHFNIFYASHFYNISNVFFKIRVVSLNNFNRCTLFTFLILQILHHTVIIIIPSCTLRCVKLYSWWSWCKWRHSDLLRHRKVKKLHR